MDGRPDPDALLAAMPRAERGPGRGRLKVYLGMAAGVGKTYAMLSDAQDARARGQDVVVGYLEPHGRAETSDKAIGLEALPTRQVDHKGAGLLEFDLDAALARRPGVLLVDELAHTNAPGSRHAKRWQDVLELLDAGIDVATTVNVQHLESLNDVVAQITGVVVTETVPDHLLSDAEEIELIDLPPEELHQRLRDGKVYAAEKVDQALQSFFRQRNLVALRELALRQAADRVDQDVRRERAAEGATEPWASGDRVLACLAPNRLGARVVRAAKRLGDALHAPVVACTVASPRQSGVRPLDRASVDEALRLAESLGMETATLAGDDIVGEILSLARSRNVTTIVVGKPIRPRWRELLVGSVVDTLVRRSGDIDVHVITSPERAAAPVQPAPESGRLGWAGVVEAGIAVGLATGLCVLLDGAVSPVNLVMVYLLATTVVAVRNGRPAAFLACLLSVGTFNWAFVPPRGSFAVADVQYVLTFGVMLAVGLILSTLASRVRQQSLDATERERTTAALYDLGRRLASSRSRVEVCQAGAAKVREVLGADAAVWFTSRTTGALYLAAPSAIGLEDDPQELAVAQWAHVHAKTAGHGTDTLPGATGRYQPLQSPSGVVGVLGVAATDGERWTPRRVHVLETVANVVALAVERTNLAKSSHEASLELERERLRGTLLSSVSHDLRTPLSVIAGAAATLSESARLTDPRDRALATSIAEEADRLGRQVRDLLDMTRVQSGSVELDRRWQSVHELVATALSRTESLLGRHHVSLDLPPDLPLLRLDAPLVEQVLVNVLENAARHTPPGTHVWVSAELESPRLHLRLANDGPDLDPGETERVFEPFYRKGGEGGRGFGLGLAIVRAVVEAHGGTVRAGGRPGGGVVFELSWPLEKDQPEVPVG